MAEFNPGDRIKYTGMGRHPTSHHIGWTGTVVRDAPLIIGAGGIMREPWCWSVAPLLLLLSATFRITLRKPTRSWVCEVQERR